MIDWPLPGPESEGQPSEEEEIEAEWEIVKSVATITVKKNKKWLNWNVKLLKYKLFKKKFAILNEK